MAKVRSNVGENVSGKVGKFVFYTLRGKEYVRLAQVREKDSWTPTQELHRSRFRQVVNLWKQVRDSNVPQIWNQASEAMNGYASFMKANLPAFTMDGTLIDPHMLYLSAGKLPVPLHLHAERTGESSTTISVSWQNDPLLKGEKLKDELLVISSGDGKFSNVGSTGISRSAQQGTFELPAKLPNPTHIYLFFASRDKKSYSDSVCFEI